MYRLIFWPVLAPSFLFSVGTGAVMPVLVLAALQLGAGEALASALVAIAGAAALLSTVPVGMFIDRVGDRRAMVIATSTAALLLGLTALALAWRTEWSLALYIGALVLRSPAISAWGLARQAVVAEALPPHERGRGMTALGGTMRAGNLVGPLCGALLLVWLPLWSVFAFAVVVAVAATALLFVRRLNDRFDATTRRAQASRTPEELAQGVRWGVVGLAGTAIITLAVCRVGQPILIALWGTRLGWSEAQISLVVAMGSAIELVLMFPGGYLKDVLGRAAVLFACLAVYGAGFVLAPLWPTSVGFVVAVVVMSVGNGLGAGINMTIGADLSPNVGRARFLSIWVMFTQGGQLGGPLVISGLLLAATLPWAMSSVGLFAWFGALWTAGFARPMGLPGRAGRVRAGS